ncbi:MAG: 1-acyl-sn-glycerol-3-phosphate acyltransferase [Cyanobacteria bacterium J06639_18]
MPHPIERAQPPLEFIPPALNPLFLRVTQFALPIWIDTLTAIAKVEADNVEILIDLIRQFQEKKIRLMVAFRHPQVEDPLCLGYLLSKLVPQTARERGIVLQHPIHAHFIYDRGIPLWAGSHIGWVLSRLGGTPIQRGKADWTGLRSARNLFANGNFPIAAAPEGATNGLSEILNPLEPGIAQLSFWCAEDLHKAQRNEQVLILPIGIQYSYVDSPWGKIEQILTELEISTGLTPSQSGYDIDLPQESLYPRLISVAKRLLSLMEEFYQRFYHENIPTAKIPETDTSDGNEAIAVRLQALLDTALQVSEKYFDLRPKGNFTDRCRRVEQAGWNYIFREEFKDIKALSAVERGLADKIAEEANLRMWHMRLVESFVAVTGRYVREKPSAERFAETTLLLWDMVTRIEGGNSFKRPQLGKQKAKITIGKPISVSERFAAYKSSRRGAREAVAQLTLDLQQAMEGLIF